MDGLNNLGIDGYSILIYIVNFGLLLSVLTYFLYRPILGYIDQRRKHISDKIHEADKIKADFEKKLNQMEKAKEKAQAELKAELDQMRRFVDEKRAELVKEMEVERDKMVAKTNAELDQRKAELVKDTEKHLLDVMQRIILEIVHHKVPEDVIHASVKDAWKTFSK